MSDHTILLQSSELKATFQRINILENISKYGHISIDDIYAEVIKIHPSLSLATVYKNIVLMVEKGILNGTSEETAPTTLDEMIYLREAAMDTAQFYNKRMLEWLQDHPNAFPEYTNPRSIIDFACEFDIPSWSASILYAFSSAIC